MSDNDVFDVFISHAGEDKEEVARPLKAALDARNLHVWLDEHEVSAGSPVIEIIDQGLRHSRFGVVILSRNFLSKSKSWPGMELAALAAKASLEARHVIIPVLHGVTQNELATYSPILAGLKHLNTSEGISRVADEIERSVHTEALGPLADRQRATKATQVINPPAMVVPSYFEGRHEETKRIADFIRDDSRRSLVITGRGGTGKTALVCRVLRALEQGSMPDDLGPFLLDGIVYLSHIGSHQINVPNLYSDLCRLLPSDSANTLNALYRDPAKPTREKIFHLLDSLQNRPVIVLLDNLESLLDSRSRTLLDKELREAIDALLEASAHKVKTIITSRTLPAGLPEPGRQQTVLMESGLSYQEAVTVLQALDADNHIGLKAASVRDLTHIYELTRGFPRALEAFCGILNSDRSITFRDLLDVGNQGFRGEVIQALVGREFDSFGDAEQRVIQVLAVYGRPVSAEAVGFVMSDFDVPPVLNRLVNLHVVRKQTQRFSLHPIDQSYALSNIGRGKSRKTGDDSLDFTEHSLRSRAAEYYRYARPPRSKWKELADIEPVLAEFQLRYQLQEFKAAAAIIDEVDESCLRRWGHYEIVIGCRRLMLDRLRDRRIAADNLAQLGKLSSVRGRFKEALYFLRKALHTIAYLRETPADKRRQASYLDYLATTYMDLARFEEAVGLLDRAFILLRGMADLDGLRMQSICLGRRGVAKRCIGYVRASIKDEIAALRIAEQQNFLDRQAVEHQSLGTSYRDIGDFQSALKHYDKGVHLARAARERRREAIGLAFAGIVYRHLGLQDQVHEYSNNALEICEEIGDVRHATICIGNLGYIEYYLGCNKEAYEYFARAIISARQLEDPRSISHALLGLGSSALALGKISDAIEHLREAAELQVPEVAFSAYCHLGIARLHLSKVVLAKRAFMSARQKCRQLLRKDSRLFGPQFTLGTALVGLAVCDPDWARGNAYRALIRPAMKQYNNARSNCAARGVLLRTSRELELISRVCPTGLESCLTLIGRGLA